jgi:hypothetical protein
MVFLASMRFEYRPNGLVVCVGKMLQAFGIPIFCRQSPVHSSFQVNSKQVTVINAVPSTSGRK